MYIAPGQGQTTPWRQTFNVNRKPYHFAHSLQVYKKTSDFIHIFNEFIYVYSPKARTDNLLGTNFWCQQTALITLPICRFKKLLWSPILYACFFHVSPYVYSRGQGQTIRWRQNFDDNRKAFSLCPYVASFKMISLKSDFIHSFNDFIHIHSPGSRAETPLRTCFDVNRKLITSTICCKFQTNLFQTNLFEFWFYTHF